MIEFADHPIYRFYKGIFIKRRIHTFLLWRVSLVTMRRICLKSSLTKRYPDRKIFSKKTRSWLIVWKHYWEPLIVRTFIEIHEANKIKPFLFYWLGKKIAHVLKVIVFS
jgi:hypothetical protein